MKRMLTTLFAGAIAGAGPVSASIVDQVNNQPTNVGFSDINKGNYYIGQSFVAGITGQLTQLDLSIYDSVIIPPGGAQQPYDSPVNIYIRNSSLALLGTVSLTASQIADPPAGSFVLNQFLTFTNVSVTAGSLYYILIEPTRQVPSTYAGNGISIGGVSSNTYANGNTVLYTYSGQLQNFSANSGDLLFRTYVEPASAVPEPATWALMIGGMSLAGGMMRRRAGKVTFANA